MNVIHLKNIETPIGTMLAGATEKGICLLEHPKEERIEKQLSRLKKNHSSEVEFAESPFFEDLEQQLKEYFSGMRKEFDLALDLQGTPFQREVWEALTQIPYGETRSYEEQATCINRPKAFRAVASANANNFVSILIPCHRVIGKNGGLAGYAGGLDKKAFLLDLENKNQ